MKIKRVLLTGDDGYNSIGTRLLVHFLKDKYELKIAGTKTQQSGVGGKLNLTRDIRWEKIRVDGVEGVCVHGTPCDAIEFAQGYFAKRFDLVISGINFGPNIGGTVFSSGTFAAAVRSLIIPITKRAIVLSWMPPSLNHFFMDHDINHKLKPFLKYPGEMAAKIVDLVISNEFWGSTLVNVNFPKSLSKKVRFTKPLPHSNTFYSYPVMIDRKNKTFRNSNEMVKKKNDANYDAGAIQRGYISITLHDPYAIDKRKRKML